MLRRCDTSTSQLRFRRSSYCLGPRPPRRAEPTNGRAALWGRPSPSLKLIGRSGVTAVRVKEVLPVHFFVCLCSPVRYDDISTSRSCDHQSHQLMIGRVLKGPDPCFHSLRPFQKEPFSSQRSQLVPEPAGLSEPQRENL